MRSITRNSYYIIKPIIPRSIELYIRRWLVSRKRAHYSHVWPIDERAASPPHGWRGWPGDKQFALILTHDVDTARGHERCRQLAELEIELGFRSSFNFVAKKYAVSSDLRNYLTANGFEVGVHGLYHDGKYYTSRQEFLQRAELINWYLREWKAVGFRSPSMLRNLEWIIDLDIEYDASTFDTDPFEPQPDGVKTIFPFIVRHNSNGRKYVELPYTLPQDFTLFVLLREKNIEIWKTKLQWIRNHGGMVLLNTHPDYMNLSNKSGIDEYPIRYYRDFLEHIKMEFKEQYWHVLPREMSKYIKKNVEESNIDVECLSAPSSKQQVLKTRKCNEEKRIWIDLDNTPHVPFFKPIISKLASRNYAVSVTSRDCFQVIGLANLMSVDHLPIGKHYGKNVIMKFMGLAIRSMQLVNEMREQDISLAVSHGSRSQILAAKMLGIPSLLIEDYEYVQWIARPNWLMTPDVISRRNENILPERVLKYPGIKEDVYVPGFKPDPAIMEALGLLADHIIVTVRPPATEAHYHNPESEVLFAEVMNYLGSMEKMKMVLLPRNKKQGDQIMHLWSDLFSKDKAIIPDHAIDGLNLMWHSDFVISGGGTMNREAAALGVPVYSIFRGQTGAVDRYLSERRGLVMLQTPADVKGKIKLSRREKQGSRISKNNIVLDHIVDDIVRIIETQSRKK